MHKHCWMPYHPLGYQEHVRMLKCVLCGKLHDHGQRGERGQLIPYGFDARAGKPLFGTQQAR